MALIMEYCLTARYSYMTAKPQKGIGYSDYAGKEKYAIGVFDLTK